MVQRGPYMNNKLMNPNQENIIVRNKFIHQYVFFQTIFLFFGSLEGQQQHDFFRVRLKS